MQKNVMLANVIRSLVVMATSPEALKVDDEIARRFPDKEERREATKVLGEINDALLREAGRIYGPPKNPPPGGYKPRPSPRFVITIHEAGHPLSGVVEEG